MKKFVRNLLLLVLTLSLIVGVSGCRFIIDRGDDGDTPTEPTPQTPSQIIVETALPDSLTLAESVDLTTARTLQDAMSMEDAIESVRRSAVAISISPVGANYTGWGSGVLINTDTGNVNEYYILTCHHVICDENADIKVYVPDANYRYDNNNYIFTGKIGGNRSATQAVELVGGDAQSDVAVLKLRVLGSTISQDIRANCLAPVMDTANPVKVGQQVFAIGNSTGQLPGHVTTGTVSYLNRAVSVNGVGTMNLLEIDLNSYHGNSGGGLYNLYGEVIGLTNCGDDVNIGINYAIPLKISSSKSVDNGIVNIASQLIATASSYNYGYVSGRRLMLGFTIMTENSQVKVTEIDTSAPAYKAGLRLNDIIKEIHYGDDQVKTISNNNDFSSVVSTLKLLEEFKVVVSRKNGRVTETRTITLKYTQQYFCNTGVYEQPVA
ncbi:MAG: trypsin-like peptidase domain-containing protein [Clostridia bacterium]|nr:trypsin-like peptidase domain-containing protein [Clostridia bacterium]MBQ8197768.1 trypsin-like peptidase domain-containing protein [Clostridia bacterium]